MDSPRGRIVLMRGVLEGSLEVSEATPYLDRCLGCLGCVTACPSGVQYGELITGFRAFASKKQHRGLATRLLDRLIHETLPYPNRFRWAMRLARAVLPLRALFPGPLRVMLDLVPQHLPSQDRIPQYNPAEGKSRGKVGLLVGCVQQVLAPEINASTIRVLNANGFDVIVPRGQSCCGALGMHTGNLEAAQHLAARNFSLFPEGLDAIITNAAGCGSCIGEYGLLFRGTAREEEATKFAAQVKDLSEFLHLQELVPMSSPGKNLRVAMHDACHLVHAQGIHSAPRALIRQLPGLQLVDVPDGEICCGSAGTYNLQQPEIAAELGAKKARAIAALEVDIVVMGNIGCMVQIRKYLDQLAPGQRIQVMHTSELLALGYPR